MLKYLGLLELYSNVKKYKKRLQSNRYCIRAERGFPHMLENIWATWLGKGSSKGHNSSGITSPIDRSYHNYINHKDFSPLLDNLGNQDVGAMVGANLKIW